MWVGTGACAHDNVIRKFEAIQVNVWNNIIYCLLERKLAKMRPVQCRDENLICYARVILIVRLLFNPSLSAERLLIFNDSAKTGITLQTFLFFF